MTDEVSIPEAPFSELDRKIERINVLRSLIGQDFIDPNAPGANPLVIAEVNLQITNFLVDLLNVELGRAPATPSPSPNAERDQALEWLLSRIVAVMKNPNPQTVVSVPVPGVPPTVVVPIEPVANPQPDYGEPSVHAPLVQGGTAISRPSRKGSGIMELLKQGNPDLVLPNDPARASMSPQQRSEADAMLREAVRNAEAKAKARVEAQGK